MTTEAKRSRLQGLDTSPRATARRTLIAVAIAAAVELGIVAIANGADWPAGAFYTVSALALALLLGIALPVIEPPRVLMPEDEARGYSPDSGWSDNVVEPSDSGHPKPESPTRLTFNARFSLIDELADQNKQLSAPVSHMPLSAGAVLWMLFEGRSSADVARVFGMTEARVNGLRARARELLMEKAKEQGFKPNALELLFEKTEELRTQELDRRPVEGDPRPPASIAKYFSSVWDPVAIEIAADAGLSVEPPEPGQPSPDSPTQSSSREAHSGWQVVDLASDLFVIVYPDAKTGERVRDELVQAGKDGLVDLQDAVIVVRQRDGKIKLHRAASTSSAAGALSGGLIALMFMAPTLGTAVGEARDAVAASDFGVDADLVRQLGEKLLPGGAALIALGRSDAPYRVLERLKPYGGEVIQTLRGSGLPTT